MCSFADADWANDKGDRKSITGWVAKVNGDPISWASKKQRTVAQSTCEAELYAEAAAIQEVLWLRGLLKELGLHVQTGSRVYGTAGPASDEDFVVVLAGADEKRDLLFRGGANFVNKAMWLIINLQMEGSAGSPGPTSDTIYRARNVYVGRTRA